MLKTNMYFDKKELFIAACSDENLNATAREEKLDHLAYGRIDFYLDMGTNHKTLASVQKAGRGYLYVTYRNTSVYLKLTSEGKIVCDPISDKEEAVIIAALVRVFLLANYAINHRKVVVIAKPYRKNVHQKSADAGLISQAKIRTKRRTYLYSSSKPNGKTAWQELDLIPVKSLRRGHFRRCKNGKTIWIKESIVTVYRKKENCFSQFPVPIAPKELVIK